MLPALIRFNGEPFVDAEGRLLYKFPDLQASGWLGVLLLNGLVLGLCGNEAGRQHCCCQCWVWAVCCDTAQYAGRVVLAQLRVVPPRFFAAWWILSTINC